MEDKTEVEYQLGQCKTEIQAILDMNGIELWDAEIERLKAEKKDIEADLKHVKDKLATAQTNRKVYDEAIEAYQEAIREFEEMLPDLLTESEAVEVFKQAKGSGKFDPKTQTYQSESRIDVERFRKAAYTLEATVSAEPILKDELWTVRIFPPYEAHYREWLYGEE